MPSHQTKTRKPTNTEFEIISRSTKPDAASWGCLLLFAGVAPFFFLGKLGAWVGSFVDHVDLGKTSGWLLALVFLIYSIITFNKHEKTLRHKNQKDLDGMEVEEITIETDIVHEVGLINDNEPILAFDIGSGKILFLQGQWLRDYETYGLTEDPCEGDEGDDFINSLPGNNSFPRDKFTIVRSKNAGQVFKISLDGDYLKPVKEVDALKDEYLFGDSEVFLGDIDQLVSILEFEHKNNAMA